MGEESAVVGLPFLRPRHARLDGAAGYGPGFRTGHGHSQCRGPTCVYFITTSETPHLQESLSTRAPARSTNTNESSCCSSQSWCDDLRANSWNRSTTCHTTAHPTHHLRTSSNWLMTRWLSFSFYFIPGDIQPTNYVAISLILLLEYLFRASNTPPITCPYCGTTSTASATRPTWAWTTSRTRRTTADPSSFDFIFVHIATFCCCVWEIFVFPSSLNLTFHPVRSHYALFRRWCTVAPPRAHAVIDRVKYECWFYKICGS